MYEEDYFEERLKNDNFAEKIRIKYPKD